MAEQNLSKWQKQNQFLDALTLMGTVESACNEVGINRCTYYRWLKDEEFQKKLQDKKYYIYNLSIDYMVKLFEMAMASYMDLIVSQNESIKLRTATAIFKNAGHIINVRINSDQCQDWTEMQHDIIIKPLLQAENQETNDPLHKKYPA